MIPNHNYVHYVESAIDSVVQQDYPAKQVVVVDDASTDGSWQAILRYIDKVDEGLVPAKEGNMKVLCSIVKGVPIYAMRFRKGRGPSAARNAGMKISMHNTHVFGFLDSDDEYLPGKISKSMAVFLQDPVRIGAVYSDYNTIHTKKNITIREFKEPFDRARLHQECIVNNNTLVSKQAIKECGMYDEALRTCEDYDLWLRVSDKFMIMHIPEALVNIKVTGMGASFSVKQEDWVKNMQYVMQKARMRHA